MSDKYYYGLDAEVQRKLAAKFDPKKAAQAQAWLEAVTGRRLLGDLHANLKDGIILCEALNRIKPNTVPAINKMHSPFKERENIESYIKGCKALGMKEVDLFVTVDLYENQNMTQVVDQICTLGGIAQKHNQNLPAFGIKYSEENPRDFSEEQLRAGKEMSSRIAQGSYGYQDESKNPVLSRQIIKNVSGHQASEEPTNITKGGVDNSGHSLSGIDKIVKNPEQFQTNRGGQHGDQSGSKFCASCGAERQGAAKFCGGCGGKFE